MRLDWIARETPHTACGILPCEEKSLPLDKSGTLFSKLAPSGKLSRIYRREKQFFNLIPTRGTAGEQAKTIDNRFCAAKSTKQGDDGAESTEAIDDDYAT